MKTQDFLQTAKTALVYYVYVLIDSVQNKIFFAGKCRSDRAFDDEKVLDFAQKEKEVHRILNLLENPEMSKQIDEYALGEKNVERHIVRDNLSEQEALLLEGAIIDLLNSSKTTSSNLLN